MAQLCNRLRLHAIVAFLRAKGGLKRVEIGASGDAGVWARQKATILRPMPPFFARVDDIKMANLGTSGRRRALTP